MYSVLALGLAFFAKISTVRSSCNYYVVDDFPTAITSDCLASFGSSSSSVCTDSTTVQVSTYTTTDCTGTATTQTYTGSDVHCGGETCYAELKIGLSCSSFLASVYVPFDVCISSNGSYSKVTCSSFSNYTSDTCSGDASFSFSLDQCYTQSDSTLYISDASGYCSASASTTSSGVSTTSSGATTTSSSTKTCNYVDFDGVPLAVTSTCMSFGVASVNSKCVSSTMAEVSFYDNGNCNGAASSKTNYTGVCDGDTCYAEVSVGTDCSTFASTIYMPFGSCVEINGTNTKITCSSFSNYTSDTCSDSADYSYSLDKCYTRDGETLYITDGSGYCSIANGLNTNIFRSIIAILFVVYLFH